MAFRSQVTTKIALKPHEYRYRNHYWKLITLRLLTETFILICLIYLGQQFLIRNNFYLPLWPATGLGLTVVFLRGYRSLLGIAIGTGLSYYLNHFSWQESLWLALLFVGYLTLIRTISLRWIGAIAPIADRSVLFKWIVLILLCSALYIFILDGTISIKTNLERLLALLGILNGILCLAPLCLAFDPFTPQIYFTRQAWHWWSFAVILIAAHLLYFALPAVEALCLSGALMLALCVYGWYFGLIPLTITWMGISTLYLIGALPPIHLFQMDYALDTVLQLTMLLTFSLITSLLISAGKSRASF